MVFLANFVFNFHSDISITSYLLLVNAYLSLCKIWKNHWNTTFCFLHNIGDLIWPNFCPKDHTCFTFFGWFPIKYVRGYNINNLCCNPVYSSEKKLVKPLNNCFFWPNLHRKEVIMGHAQNGKKFFGKNNKSRSSAFRKFLFYQNIMFWLSY